MSLIGALNAGKSALAVSQAALQVTGNNISNAGNDGYTRQTVALSPATEQEFRPGVFIGTGVNLDQIQRQIDEALEGRLRGSVSDNQSADTLQQWLGRVEAIFNELTDQDLSTQLSTFFNSWSNLANKPQDIGLRQVVLQNGQAVADEVKSERLQLGNLEQDIDNRLQAQASNADQLAQQVADLNGQIVSAEGGGGGGIANGLRDQRDAVLKNLAQLIDIKTIVDGGVVNVYVGSEPLVIGAQNRGVALKQEVVNGDLKSSVIFKANQGTMALHSGQLGGLLQARSQIADVVGQVDTLAGNLIFELNKVHTSGQGLIGFSTLTSATAVDDPSVALDDPKAGLEFTPNKGGFVVHVKNKGTGLDASTLIQVNVDGTAAGTSLNDIQAAIDAIANVSAVIAGGELKISADSADVEISFSQDTSGALAALGINTFYTGSTARDIAVNQVVKSSPGRLSAARNGEPADNQTARAIALLESQPIQSLDGTTLKQSYQAMINGVAVAAASAKNNADASSVVQQTLESQRQALSGVSLDEEAINLVRQQRGFQAAARLISAVDELMKTMINMV